MKSFNSLSVEEISEILAYENDFNNNNTRDIFIQNLIEAFPIKRCTSRKQIDADDASQTNEPAAGHASFHKFFVKIRDRKLQVCKKAFLSSRKFLKSGKTVIKSFIVGKVA